MSMLVDPFLVGSGSGDGGGAGGGRNFTHFRISYCRQRDVHGRRARVRGPGRVSSWLLSLSASGEVARKNTGGRKPIKMRFSSQLLLGSVGKVLWVKEVDRCGAEGR